MDKILSIIIPTYNMHDYLDRCLQSLIIDTELLEVLVINDGSKDDSLVIAQKYEKEYPNIFRTIDKPNGNYGSCINRGLHEATGKYIKVLDADDRFDTEALKVLIEKASTVDVDAFITDFVKSYTNGKQKSVTFDLPSNTIISFFDVCAKKDIINLWMHAITYKRENLLHINYKQTEGISYTDQEWVFLPLTTIQSLIYLPVSLYIYTLGREGQTMAKDFSDSHFKDNIICASHMIDGFIELKDTPKKVKILLSEKLFKRIRFIYKFYLLKCKQPDLRHLTEFDHKVKMCCKELYHRSDQILMSRPIFLYKYIKHWRNNPKGKTLRFMIKAYKSIKSI